MNHNKSSQRLKRKALVGRQPSFPKLFAFAAIGAFVGFVVAVSRRLEPPKPLPVSLFRRFPKQSLLFTAPQAIAAVCRALSHRRSNYEATKVGFGAGKNMKTSIARVVYDCPFVDGVIKKNDRFDLAGTSEQIIDPFASASASLPDACSTSSLKRITSNSYDRSWDNSIHISFFGEKVTCMGYQRRLMQREQNHQGTGSANMSCWPNQYAHVVRSGISKSACV
ncbi:hypothetical protein Syun_028104 [Stephania yunnanensis]|uniref:Uncharacterized protein n=1 Tax=Stephania yunnanensis TaxID=152371 RepID=A0AAP0HLL8_9MAGN